MTMRYRYDGGDHTATAYDFEGNVVAESRGTGSERAAVEELRRKVELEAMRMAERTGYVRCVLRPNTIYKNSRDLPISPEVWSYITYMDFKKGYIKFTSASEFARACGIARQSVFSRVIHGLLEQVTIDGVNFIPSDAIASSRFVSSEPAWVSYDPSIEDMKTYAKAIRKPKAKKRSDPNTQVAIGSAEE